MRQEMTIAPMVTVQVDLNRVKIRCKFVSVVWGNGEWGIITSLG